MEKQNKLAKLAIAGLLLAVGCNAHGCGGKLSPKKSGKDLADNATDSTNRTDSGISSDSDNSSWNRNSSDSNTSGNRNTPSDNSTDKNRNARNSNPSSNSNPYSRNSNDSQWNSSYNNNVSENEAMSPSSSTQKPGTYNSGFSSTNRLNTSSTESMNQAAAATSKTKMTKLELIKKLSPEGRQIFSGLDDAGQDLALSLASQDSYADKDAAVKEAQRQINENKKMKNGTMPK